jgi:hypothetical protein
MRRTAGRGRLTLASQVFWPWPYSLNRKPIVITEPAAGARVRPEAFTTDWNVLATGLCADGQPPGLRAAW